MLKHKRLGFILLVATMMFLVTLTSAFAATNTGIDVVNLENAPGTVVVEFYQADGTSGGTLSSPISALGSLNFYIPNTSIASGQYSARISSDVRVAATVGLTDSSQEIGDDYLGTDSPANVISFPLVYRNFGSWNSQLVVQNASDTSQTVNIEFFKNGSTSADASDSATIPAFSYVIFDMANYGGFGNDYGVAVATGTAPLAGVALAERDPGTGVQNKAQLTYRAFTASQEGQSLVAPLYYKNFNGFATGLNVVNRGNVATNVTVEFRSSNGVSGGPWTATRNNLQPGEGYTFYTPSIAGLPDNLFGSATITSSAANIALVASHSRFASGSQQAFAYEAVSSAAASGCVAAPVVQNRTTWKSGLNILNLGSSSASVTINYSSSNPSTPDASQTVSIPANDGLTVYMPTDGTTASGFYGGATFESASNIVVLVSTANSAAGIARNFMGVNYTCP